MHKSELYCHTWLIYLTDYIIKIVHSMPSHYKLVHIGRREPQILEPASSAGYF